MKSLARSVLSFGGIGFLPKGSWVTIVLTSFVWPWVFPLLPADHTLRITVIIISALLLFIVGAWTIPIFCTDGKHDHEWIVLDEVLGTLIAASPLLLSQNTVSPLTIAIATTCVFGFFDGLKPLGIQRIDDAETLPITVMLDDVVAGVYAAGVMLLVLWWIG